MNYLLHLVVLLVLIYIASKKGIEHSLPFLAFVIIIMPDEAQITLPGLFDITIQRTIIIALIIMYFVQRGKGLNDTIDQKIPLKYIIITAVAWSLLSNLNSIVLSISLKRMLSFVLEYYIIYFIFCRTITNIKTIENILVSTVIAVSVTCLFGTIEAYSGWSIMNIFPEVGRDRFQISENRVVARESRIMSVFPHPILFGGVITLAIPLAFHTLAVAQKRWLKPIIWCGILLMFLCSYKTSSRGPWLALMFSFAVLLLLHKKVRKYIFVIFLLASMTIIIRPGVFQSLKGMWNATFDPSSQIGSSYIYRYALFDVIKEALAQEPERKLWGYGQGSFYYLGLETEFQGRTYRFLSCDSAWGGILIETGYIGLMIMVLLFGKVTYLTFKDFIINSDQSRYLSLVLFTVQISFYSMMTNVAIYGWGQVGHLLWILIALAIVYGKLIRTEKYGFAQINTMKSIDH